MPPPVSWWPQPPNDFLKLVVEKPKYLSPFVFGVHLLSG
jgi:hypothetical protein